MKKQTVAGIVALATSLAAAHGAMVSADAFFTSHPVGGPDFVVNLPKFDPALGALTQIDFTLEIATSDTMMVFDNEGVVRGNAAFKLDTQVQAKSGSIVSTATALSTVSASGSVAADNDGVPNFMGSDSLPLIGGTNSVGDFTENASNILAQYTGANSAYPVTVSSGFTSSAVLTSAGTGVSGVFNAPSQNISGHLIVTYTYAALAAVPEAGTVLFGAALGLAIAFRRLRPRLA